MIQTNMAATRRVLLLGAAAIAALASNLARADGVDAAADADAGTGLSEVLVTAEKRETNDGGSRRRLRHLAVHGAASAPP